MNVAVVSARHGNKETELESVLDPLDLSADTRGILTNLSTLQEEDPYYHAMMVYIAEGDLPTDDKMARRVVMESRYFDTIDNVLYHESPHFPGR